MRNRLILIGALLLALAAPAAAGERGLLWRVVQTCLADQTILGASFPCLAVDTTGGVERGYAVLRAPLQRLHVIVTPTVRTIGIEADRLLAPDAPNYFADAWRSRHFVVDDLAHKPGRADFAMAINSREGRSQDQLHIHVACVRPDVKRALAGSAGSLQAGRFVPVRVSSRMPHYMAMPLAGPDLERQDPFQLVASGLKPADMADVTIVVVGSGDDARGGFILLARSRIRSLWDEGHGEDLLDGSCRAFR